VQRGSPYTIHGKALSMKNSALPVDDFVYPLCGEGEKHFAQLDRVFSTLDHVN
jgi:hypothetical protein